MTLYKVQIGHDASLMSLVDISPQPSNGVATPVERLYSVSGRVFDTAFYLALTWDFIEDEQEYYDLLFQFGIESNESEDVTVYAKDNRLQWKRFNGRAQVPEVGPDMRWRNFFPRDVVIYIVDLEELA